MVESFSSTGCSHCSPLSLMMERVDAYERAVALIRNARDGSSAGEQGVLPQGEISAPDVLALAAFLAGADSY